MNNEIEQLEHIATLIDKFGPVVVVFALLVILVLIYSLVTLNNSSKIINDYRETNKDIKNAVLNTNKTQKPYEEKSIVELFVKLNSIFKGLCEKLSNETDSSRSAIYVFHNGSQSSHGLPFFKMSCICEYIPKGSIINSKAKEHTNLPLNIFDTIINDLFYNGVHEINKNTESDPDDLLFIKDTKIVYCIFITIYDSSNNIMGFIVNGYNDKKPENIQEVKEKMINLAEKVKPVIEFTGIKSFKS